MIQPSPTTRIDEHLARGILLENADATSTRPARLVIEFPNSSYQTHLIPDGPISAIVGKRIIGTIRVEARRIDRVDTGGRYLEPVMGRPRRVQGAVIATDPNAGTITVNAGIPIALAVSAPGQSADDFQIGDLVSCDVRDGATFVEAAR